MNTKIKRSVFELLKMENQRAKPNKTDRTMPKIVGSPYTFLSLKLEILNKSLSIRDPM